MNFLNASVLMAGNVPPHPI